MSLLHTVHGKEICSICICKGMVCRIVLQVWELVPRICQFPFCPPSSPRYGIPLIGAYEYLEHEINTTLRSMGLVVLTTSD